MKFLQSPTIQSKYARDKAKPFIIHFITLYNLIAILAFSPLIYYSWIAYVIPALLLTIFTVASARRLNNGR